MSTVWKIIRIVGLYVGSFIVCVLIAALTMEPLPDGIQVLFAMLVPVAVVRWYEAGRSARLVQDRGFQKQPVFDLSPRYRSDEVSGKRMPDKFEAELGHVAAKASEAVRLTLEQSRREAQKSGDARMTGSQRQSSSSEPQGWVPKGQAVTIAGRQIDGMIYVGPAPRLNSHGYGEKCRAYIDPSLSVAALGSDKRGDNLSYWPGYSSIPAVCRATYLDWLADGRRDGTVNPGYMFLYFYGLERRFLLDDPSDFEKQEIISEVQRLKHLFAHNYSAQRYLGEFLGIASIATLGGISPDDPDLKASILENRNWELPIALKMVIGTLVANGEPVDAEWMYLWFICHPEARLRTSAKRCAEEFKQLFLLRYASEYPDGAKIRKPKRKLEFQYRAASGEFTGNFLPSTGQSGDTAIPDISDLRSPVEGAQIIADQAMGDLDKYSRLLGRNPEARGTIEAQALLPPELWSRFPSSPSYAPGGA